MAEALLDDVLLQAFMRTFYGYGSYTGDYWFVGMEEGGGNSAAEIVWRLACWDEQGRRELEDVAAFHRCLGYPYFFEGSVKLQRTWARLISIVLSSQGRPLSLEAVRAYQRDHLGRPDGDTCLVELLPLPAPNTASWQYGDLSRLPFLATREAYRQHVAVDRAAHLRQRIGEHQPKHVVFYGFAYQSSWEHIAGCSLTPTEIGAGKRRKLLVGRKGTTAFAVTYHPAASGITKAYFHQVGQTLSSL